MKSSEEHYRDARGLMEAVLDRYGRKSPRWVRACEMVSYWERVMHEEEVEASKENARKFEVMIDRLFADMGTSIESHKGERSMSIDNPRKPHPDCGFAASEPNTLEAIYVVEFWCLLDENGTWGWDTLSVHYEEDKARRMFEDHRLAYFWIRIRRVGKVLSLGTIIDYYNHEHPKGKPDASV